jgi:[ribosomal protein S5]-alanine N-acetyltransferase
VVLVTDPEVRRFLPPGPDPTLATFETVLRTRNDMEKEIGYSMWAVDDKATRTFVGQCGIRPVDEGAGPEVDLAYHFFPTTWNRGYATEAAVAVLAYGLGSIGLERIMAVVVPENVGSWRVMEKAGMRYVGRVNYYGMDGLKKYEAERSWWKSPLAV